MTTKVKTKVAKIKSSHTGNQANHKVGKIHGIFFEGRKLFPGKAIPPDKTAGPWLPRKKKPTGRANVGKS